MKKVRITGTGSYLPEKILTNSDLEKFLDPSDEWIVSRTGIRERRVAAEGEFTSDLAWRAAAKALEMTGLATSPCRRPPALSNNNSAVCIHIDRYDNASGATMPIAVVDVAVRDGRVVERDLVMLDAFGGDFTWASAPIRW